MPRRPKPPDLKIVEGTARADRPTARVVEPLDGEPQKPAWLRPEAEEIWGEKVAIYAARGQSVVGCEAALAQYCTLEAALIDRWATPGSMPSAAELTQYRMFAREFYDTPASQVATVPKDRGEADRPPAHKRYVL